MLPEKPFSADINLQLNGNYNNHPMPSTYLSTDYLTHAPRASQSSFNHHKTGDSGTPESWIGSGVTRQ